MALFAPMLLPTSRFAIDAMVQVRRLHLKIKRTPSLSRVRCFCRTGFHTTTPRRASELTFRASFLRLVILFLVHTFHSAKDSRMPSPTHIATIRRKTWS